MKTLGQRLRLVLVTDRAVARVALETVVARALRGGVTAVMLREKDLRGRDLLALATRLRARTRAARAAMIVNERVDVALAAGAEGVHLGGDAMPLGAARRIAPMLLVGISVHSAREGIERVRRERPDYAIIGPIFRTPDRRGRERKAPPIGLGELRALCDAVRVPIVAIGGIDADRARDAILAGADGVAAIRALVGSRAPERAARDLAAAVDAALAERSRLRTRSK